MAEEQLKEIRVGFYIEALEKLENCEESILAWESDPSNETHLATIKNDLHSIKGNANSLDMAGLSKFVHYLEDELERKSPDRYNYLLKRIDVIKKHISSSHEDDLKRDCGNQFQEFKITQLIKRYFPGKL